MDLIVKYKNKIWKVLEPENLVFPPYCIRNVWIERGNRREITHREELKVLKITPRDITEFF